MGQAEPSSLPKTLKTLSLGKISLEGEFIWGSNYTFLADIEHEEHTLQGVYKPSRGERPLWDFPRASLAHREVAAYLVSQALGWRLVPPTVYRRKAPAGPGSLQLFVSHDPEYHYFNFSPADRERLRPTVLFDYLINNADRKASHVLVDDTQHIWLIDHGVCFHEEDKLRTVIWDFCGQPIPAELRADLSKFEKQLLTDEKLVTNLRKHLANAEIGMLAARARWLAEAETFPNPPTNRRANPWPPI
jgi:uncharacterized repeat protein (TIGR03843 family)